MFDTVRKAAAEHGRKESALRKLKRLYRALRHEEPDRVVKAALLDGTFHEPGILGEVILSTPRFSGFLRAVETAKAVTSSALARSPC